MIQPPILGGRETIFKFQQKVGRFRAIGQQHSPWLARDVRDTVGVQDNTHWVCWNHGNSAGLPRHLPRRVAFFRRCLLASQIAMRVLLNG